MRRAPSASRRYLCLPSRHPHHATAGRSLHEPAPPCPSAVTSGARWHLEVQTPRMPRPRRKRSVAQRFTLRRHARRPNAAVGDTTWARIGIQVATAEAWANLGPSARAGYGDGGQVPVDHRPRAGIAGQDHQRPNRVAQQPGDLENQWRLLAGQLRAHRDQDKVRRIVITATGDHE
jgi:hypothetical protein